MEIFSKIHYVVLIVLEIGTASTVINFKDSMVGMVIILAWFGIIPGSDAIACCNKKKQS